MLCFSKRKFKSGRPRLIKTFRKITLQKEVYCEESHALLHENMHDAHIIGIE
jgi:hypothetical protein